MAFSVSYIYTIHDRYSAKLKKINKATNKFVNKTKKAQAVTKNFSHKMMGMQSAITSVATAIGGARIADTFVSFERQMNKLAAIALTSSDKLSEMRAVAKHLGETTEFTATQVVAGMEQLKQAGLSVDDVIAAIPGTLELAAAGGLNMARAADVATSAVGAMGMKYSELSRVNDVLAFSQSKTKSTIEEMHESMRPVATTASSLGFNIEQLVSILGVMAQAGERGSIAGTGLRRAFTNLSGASKKQRKIYKALGIEHSKYVDKVGKIKNFDEFIDKMHEAKKAGKLSTAVLERLFGQFGFRAIQAVMKRGTGAIKAYNDEVNKAHGTSKKMAETRMAGLPGAIKRFTSILEGLTIALFEAGLGDFLDDVTRKAVGMIRWIRELDPAILKIISAIGTFVIIGGPLILTIGLLSSAVSAAVGGFAALGSAIALLTTPIGVVVGALALLGLAIFAVWKDWGGIRTAWASYWDRVITRWKDRWANFTDSLKVTIEKYSGYMKTAGDMMKKILSGITDKIDNVKDKLSGFLTYGRDVASKFKNFFGIEGKMKVHGFDDEPANRDIAAENAVLIREQGDINGKIDISTPPGVKAKASMKTSFKGNLGFNMAAYE